MLVIKPPYKIPELENNIGIFLAGSIEMDTAEHWQKRAEELIKEQETHSSIFRECVIFNPRRDSWESSQKQDITNPFFEGQVTWELDALEVSHHIIMYFDPKTKSPISLLELGLHARSGKLKVVCSEGFWRKGNVDVVCKRFHIPQFTTLEEAIYNIFN